MLIAKKYYVNTNAISKEIVLVLYLISPYCQIIPKITYHFLLSTVHTMLDIIWYLLIYEEKLHIKYFAYEV